MKKQYQLVIGILVTCVFFCTNQKDNLKACGTNTTACATLIKNNVQQKAVTKKDAPGGGYVDDSDGGIYRFMNPFIQ